MTKNIGYLNTSSQFFGNLYSQVNTLCQVLANEIVTANSAAGGGAMSAGNGFVVGIFGANTLVATTLQGGNVTSTSQVFLGANLNANDNSIIDGNVSINATALYVGNSTVYWEAQQTGVLIIGASSNVSLNSSSFSSGNSTANNFSNSIIDVLANSTSQTVITPASITVANSTTTGLLEAFILAIGNSTVNAVINSSGYFFDGTSIATTVPGTNTEVVFNNSSAFGGSSGLTYNYTTNTLTIANTANIGGTLLVAGVANVVGSANVGNNLGVANTITAGANGYVSGNTTVNSTAFNLGNSVANTFINSTAFLVSNATDSSLIQPFFISLGNSTVNAVINSSGYYYDGTSLTVSPPGSNTDVGYNNSGAFAASGGLTFNYTSNTLTVGNTGSIIVGNSSVNAVINGNGLWINNNPIAPPTTQTLAFGSTVSWNVAAGQIATCTLANSEATIAAPTNLIPGSYVLILIQNSSGGCTVSWNNIFKWPASTLPVLSTGGTDVDVFTFVYDGSRMIGSWLLDIGA